jgi:hypothetical protein
VVQRQELPLYDRTISNEFQGPLCPKNYPSSPLQMLKSQPNSRFQTIAVTFYPLDRFKNDNTTKVKMAATAILEKEEVLKLLYRSADCHHF